MDVRIIHFYPDLMSLYGSYANVLALKRYLERLDCDVTVESVLPGGGDGAVGLKDVGMAPQHQVRPLLHQELGHLFLVAVLLGAVLNSPVGDNGDKIGVQCPSGGHVLGQHVIVRVRDAGSIINVEDVGGVWLAVGQLVAVETVGIGQEGH